MEISVIITYHQEGQAFLEEAVNCVKNTIDVSNFEIIVVDDCSKEPLNPISNVKIIRNSDNFGVGTSFDNGVAIAKYENIILMACDIRIIQKNWASQMVEELNKYPKSLVCTSCINLNREKPENMDIENRKKISVVNGATILIFHDHKTNPRMTISFRGLIEASWLPSLKNRNVPSFEIPCILGAFYGVKKDWYNYIDGFYGHRKWGSLEPIISIKSWIFGGSCRTAPKIEVGHIFKKAGIHGTSQDTLIYNKMLAATLLFPDYGRLIAFLGSNPIVERARKMYQANLPVILKKREEYQKKTVFSMEQFVKKWNVDYRH
jgi:glycosyltransferase involved in cell wall biosynthesis